MQTLKGIKGLERTEERYLALRDLLADLAANSSSSTQIVSALRKIGEIAKGIASIGVCIRPSEWIVLNSTDKRANWRPAEKSEADLFTKAMNAGTAEFCEGLSSSSPLIAMSSEGQTPLVLVITDTKDSKWSDSTIEGFKELMLPLSLAVQYAMSLQEANRSVRQTELLLDLFFHDIRNFINTARTSLELLEIDSSNVNTREEYIAIALDQTDGITNLLARVKSILSKKQPGELASVNLIEALRESISIVMSQYGEVIVEIGLNDELEDGTPLVLADQLLSEVFVNILTNAIKYTEEETKCIDIDWSRWSVNPSFVVISFSDRGKGIPEHLKSKVFGRFALESSTGMGLGLNAILRLVEQYAGHLWFEDRVEGDHSQGTVVNVALRLVDD
ncbi:MAG: HAMP domain-containing histidine kinase [Candidatus Thorarchaeota archaeon]|nr:HAMP domain-containing histidine kinase [Candidatus Thorarchaeota archaeon]